MGTRSESDEQTRSVGPRDSGRTVFFPGGRNGPARPSAAGRSRPPDSLPFLPGPTRMELHGRATAILFCVSVYTLYMPVTICRRPPCLSSLSFARICAVCVPCISPARVLHTTRSTVPPGPAWYHPPSRRWRGGSGASRRSLVPRPPGPHFSGRVPLPAP